VILNPSDNVADRYQESIDVELLNKMAPAIGFSLRDKVEQRGKDFLRKLIENYTRATISEKNRITKTTLQFIDQRLALLATELNTTESEFEGFRSDRGLTDMSSQSKMYLQNVQSNDSRLNEVSIQLNVIEGVEKYVNSSQNDEYLPSTLGISDPALSSLIEKISLLQLQKNKLLATTPESNPLFDPIKTQINLTRAAIKENIKTLKSSLLDTKEELELFNKKFESSIKNIPGQERRLLSIQRQLAIKENLYVYLLQKKEELSLSYASTLPDSRIIDPPYSEPLKKHFQLFVLVGAILLGLLVPGGLIYIRDGFSNKITKAKEIEDAISAPIISELPFKRSSSSIVVLDNKNFEIGEQFRFLRTKLNLLHQRTEKGKVTLVSSSISGEGKSFVSSNLSVALAIAGKRTILIDLDLRKPELASIFDLQADHPGICDLLERNLTLKEIVQPSGIHSNLEIISTGNIPVNPSELLESASLDFFMKSLSLIYDHIIIDTAPVHLVTDALILSRFSGVMLYLIRQGETFKSLLPFIESVNTSKSFSNINIVFNGVEKLRYGYGDDYGGRYYQDMKVKKKNKGGKRLKDLFKRL